MYKKISIALFLLLLAFQSINTKVITTNNLKEALSQVNPGDTIELKSGTYQYVQYQLKNGTQKERITIKSAPNAEVYFKSSSSNCVFEATGLRYVTFEGPINIIDSLCGFKLINSYSVNITDVRFFDIKSQAIIITGTDNVLYKNQIYGCVTENRYTAKTRTGGWNKCVSVMDGCCHQIKNNTISFSYGESLYLANISSTVVAHNEITNGLSANIYINTSKWLDIDGNILRVNSTEYDNKYGSACGIAMTNMNKDVVNYINITNNIILGTRIGIHFFMQDVKGGYEFINIIHNTLWNVHVTPIWFNKPEIEGHSYGVRSQLKNNFIYFEGAKEFEPKKFWDIGYNIYYNTKEVPSIYSDTTSKAAKDLPLNTVFNQINSCSDYFNLNLKPECLRPSKEPEELQLFHTGTNLKYKVVEDIAYCRRSSDSPSIGAFEFTEGCSGDILPPIPPTDAPTDAPIRDYDVRFNITYCTEDYNVMKIVGSFCNYQVGSADPMIQDKKCHWTYTFRDGTTKEFRYKFVDSIEGSAYKVESDPFRIFKGSTLAKLARKSIAGKYEDCDYSISGDMITLVCTWR